jgi:hypothetical protein
MKFIRCQTIAVVEAIKPYLMVPPIVAELCPLEKEDYLEQTAAELKQVIETRPKGSYLIDVCIAGDDILGFSISYVISNEMIPRVHLSQMWVKTFDKQRFVSRGLYQRLLSWAENMGLQYITCETPRNPEAIARSWGFEPRSTIMVLDLTKEERPDPSVLQNEVDPKE